MKRLPKNKSANIVVQELAKELLIYDLETHKSYCLNETSKIVYEACDGEIAFNELREKHHLPDEVIWLALDRLSKENLLEEDYVSPFAGLSRREAIRRIGSASMLVLPVVAALVVPTAASAQSASCQNPGGQPNGTTVMASVPLPNTTTRQFHQSHRRPSAVYIQMPPTPAESCQNALAAQCCNGAIANFQSTPDPPNNRLNCQGVCTSSGTNA